MNATQLACQQWKPAHVGGCHPVKEDENAEQKM